MLRQPKGVTVAQIAEATGWAQHTVRSFFAGLKKKGYAVEVRERVGQVGLNKTGTKGSFTIYALTEWRISAKPLNMIETAQDHSGSRCL